MNYYSNKKSINDIKDFSGKKILVRCDFNVPFKENGDIADSRRIDESLKTIKFLLEKNSKILLCSHLGRPKGQVNAKLSLKPVLNYLEKALNQKISFIEKILDESAVQTVNSMKNKDICLFENLRFFSQEEQNDELFSKKLASFAEIYVNDAFGTCHRVHASTVGITKFLPSVYGFLVQKEISVMSEILKKPKKPFIAVLGGSKVFDKIGVLNNLLEKVDVLIIGGGMAYTFMNALGYPVGTSICETDKLDLAKDVMAKAKARGVKLILPVDNKVGLEYSPDTEAKIVDADKIPNGWMGLDIGTKTAKIFADALKNAGTVIWNGPVGVSEWERFSHGTLAVAKAIAESNAVSIIGGGDSAAAIEKLGLADKMTHVSTGGGASLMFLEGKEIPAFMALDNK